MSDQELVAALHEALRQQPIPEVDNQRVSALREAAEGLRTARNQDHLRVAELRPVAPPEPSRRAATPTHRWLVAAAAIALVAGAVGLGAWLSRADDPTPTSQIEYAGSIEGTGGAGELRVTKTGIGRIISFDTDQLEILPTGEYYELWFVAPDDQPASPNRISAGTFHPDADGRSDIDFTAAVDPALYPRVEITAEPGDGNPATSGNVVLETVISP